MRPFRPLRDASPPAALPALLRATHLFGLALGSALDAPQTPAILIAPLQLERMAGPLVSEVSPGLAPQLPVHQRDEALEGLGIATVPRDEEAGHVAWR